MAHGVYLRLVAAEALTSLAHRHALSAHTMLNTAFNFYSASVD